MNNEEDFLLFEIKQHKKRTRTSFESVINKKNASAEEFEEVFNDFN